MSFKQFAVREKSFFESFDNIESVDAILVKEIEPNFFDYILCVYAKTEEALVAVTHHQGIDATITKVQSMPNDLFVARIELVGGL